MQKILSLFFVFLLIACAPVVQDVGSDEVEPRLATEYFVSSDNRKLPLRQRLAVGETKGIIIGVHGFNDYGNFLNPYFPDKLAKKGYHLVTYDQRGFGDNPDRGLFSSEEALTLDLKNLVDLIYEKHQPAKLYLFGESMGAAIVAATLKRYPDLKRDGVILSAPAVWAPSTWPWIQRVSLNFMSHLIPSLSLSGGGIVQPTDNRDVWYDWSKDPLVVRGTRIDALWGVSQIMESALESAPELNGPMLILYGANDEIIPPEPMHEFIEQLKTEIRFAYYPDGWHMLPRDHQHEVIFKDVIHFFENPDAALPSAQDQDAQKRLKQSF